MSTRDLLPITVDIDKIALSLLGWEAVGLQARFVRGRSERSHYHNMVTMAGELRFDPDDWHDRYNASNLFESDYLPGLVWQLRSAQHGSLMSYQNLTYLKAKELRAPKMISESTNRWYSTFAHSPDDLSIHITAVDWDEIDGYQSRPSATWTDVAVEFVDQTTRKSLRTEVRELVARVRDEDSLEVTLRAQFALGTVKELLADATGSYDYPDAPVMAGVAEFMVQAPEVTVSTFDETGFLLKNRTLSNYRWVKVTEGGRVPQRPPTLIVVTSTDLDDLAGNAARVVVRVTDPVE